jgi:hypothetical protein
MGGGAEDLVNIAPSIAPDQALISVGHKFATGMKMMFL